MLQNHKLSEIFFGIAARNGTAAVRERLDWFDPSRSSAVSIIFNRLATTNIELATVPLYLLYRYR